jgi:hypothetical protein
MQMPHQKNSCGMFISARDQARNGNHSNETLYAYWLTGFLTGVNLGMPDTFDIAGGTDLPSLLQWLENRCKQEPLESFADTASVMVFAIRDKRTRSGPERGEQK